MSFFLFCTIWFFLLGFGFPVVIAAGFIFGTILGSLLLLMGFACGSTALYVFANYYFKDLVIKYFSNKYKAVEPIAKPISNRIEPKKEPNIKPAAIMSGKPKPSKKNQMVENKKNKKE